MTIGQVDDVIESELAHEEVFESDNNNMQNVLFDFEQWFTK